MDTSGLYISAALLKSLSPEKRAFAFGLLSGEDEDLAPMSKPPAPVIIQSNDEGHQADEDEQFAEFSPSQAREFYVGCGEKTKKAVEAIAASPSCMIQVSDIAKAVGVNPWDLRGVWSGLTRRTITITGDAKARLFDWQEGTQKYDSAGNYVDQTGKVTELTHNSFRKLLKL
jgi:hypothetical protein